MSEKRLVIGVNREYNYHPAFHGEIFSILEEKFTLRELPVINFSEAFIRTRKGSFFSRQVFSSGRFNGEADLMFSSHILLANSSNWVMDLEHPFWLFTDHYDNTDPNSFSFRIRKKVAKKWIGHRSCKSVIAWSDASKNILIDFLGEEFVEKVRVIYPMVSSPVVVRRPRDWVTLLFVMPNKNFEQRRKGKDAALEIFRVAGREFNKVKFIFIGYLTESEKAEFGNQMEHYSSVDRKTLLSEIYTRSDILLFPSRADTFGAVVIEAQSIGVIPIATYGRSVFSTPELIRNGENGFLIRNKESCGNELDFQEVDIQKFCEIVRLLIGNDELRRKLSCQSREKYVESKHNPKNQKEAIISLFLNFMQIKK